MPLPNHTERRQALSTCVQYMRRFFRSEPISRLAARKELLEGKKLRAFTVLMLKTGHLGTGQQFA